MNPYLIALALLVGSAPLCYAELVHAGLYERRYRAAAE